MSQSLRWLLLFGWTAVAVVLMAVSYLGDPGIGLEQLEGTARYGHNSPRILGTVLPLVGLELFLLIVILRPWSYHHSVGRALAALGLLFPWTFLCMLFSLHGGGVVVFHFWYVAGFTLAMIITTMVSGKAVMDEKKHRQRDPAPLPQATAAIVPGKLD